MDAKNKLLTTATTLFAQKGYHGTSIREIASSASVNSSLISYYFGSKLGLYKEILSNYRDSLLLCIDSINLIGLNPNKSLIESFKLNNGPQDHDLLRIVMRALFNKEDTKSYNIVKETFNIVHNSMKVIIAKCTVKKQYSHFATTESLYLFIISMSKCWEIFSDLLISEDGFKNEAEIKTTSQNFIIDFLEEILE